MFLCSVLLISIYASHDCVSQSVNNTEFGLSDQLNDVNKTSELLSDTNFIFNLTDNSDVNSVNNNYSANTLLKNDNKHFLNDSETGSNFSLLNYDKYLIDLNNNFEFNKNISEKIWESLIKYGKENSDFLSNNTNSSNESSEPYAFYKPNSSEENSEILKMSNHAATLINDNFSLNSNELNDEPIKSPEDNKNLFSKHLSHTEIWEKLISKTKDDEFVQLNEDNSEKDYNVKPSTNSDNKNTDFVTGNSSTDISDQHEIHVGETTSSNNTTLVNEISTATSESLVSVTNKPHYMISITNNSKDLSLFTDNLEDIIPVTIIPENSLKNKSEDEVSTTSKSEDIVPITNLAKSITLASEDITQISNRPEDAISTTEYPESIKNNSEDVLPISIKNRAESTTLASEDIIEISNKPEDAISTTEYPVSIKNKSENVLPISIKNRAESTTLASEDITEISNKPEDAISTTEYPISIKNNSEDLLAISTKLNGIILLKNESKFVISTIQDPEPTTSKSGDILLMSNKSKEIIKVKNELESITAVSEDLRAITKKSIDIPSIPNRSENNLIPIKNESDVTSIIPLELHLVTDKPEDLISVTNKSERTEEIMSTTSENLLSVTEKNPLSIAHKSEDMLHITGEPEDQVVVIKSGAVSELSKKKNLNYKSRNIIINNVVYEQRIPQVSTTSSTDNIFNIGSMYEREKNTTPSYMIPKLINNNNAETSVTNLEEYEESTTSIPSNPQINNNSDLNTNNKLTKIFDKSFENEKEINSIYTSQFKNSFRYDNVKYNNNSMFMPNEFPSLTKYATKKPVIEYQNDKPVDDSTDDAGVSLAFVFDATGSMWDDLVQVREGAAKILNAMLERPDKPIYNYVLVPFRDPDVGPVTVTTDLAYFKEKLDLIQVIGGSDCPEMSVGAVKLALELSRPNSYIYVFTDASSKDYYLIDDVLPLIQEKLSKVVFVMTGDCGDPRHPGFLVYQKIASTSSGQVYHLNKSDVNEVLNFIQYSLPLKPHKVNLLSVDHAGEPTVNKSHHHLPLPVDTSLSEFTVSISGRKASLGVVHPNGTQAVPPRVTPLLNLENVKVVNVKEPDPGLWTLKVGSDSQYTVRSTGLSSSNFGYGFSIQPTRNKEETSTRPLKGTYTNLLVWATEPETDTFSNLELVGINGKVYETFKLEPVGNENGLYRTPTFMPPDDFFYINVQGISKDGHPFKRITSTAISGVKAERPGVSATAVVHGQANRPVVLSCYVKSLLPFDVRWFKNGAKIGKLHHYLQTSHVNLEFPAVSKDDEGVYICRINNTAGLTYRQIKLTVKGEPPVVRADESSKAVPGETGVINCIVLSSVPYNISWKKSTSEATNLVDLKEKIAAGKMKLLSNNSLIINHVELEDEGWYTCVAQSDAGVSSGRRTRFNVQERPQISVYPEKVELLEGGSFTLSCAVLKGTPVPSLTWEKDGVTIERFNRFITEVVSNILELKLINARAEDEGVYSCVAKNAAGIGHGSATVVNIKQPVVSTEGQKWIVINGSTNGFLHCSVHVVPAFNITWVKGDIVFNPLIWKEMKNMSLNYLPKYNVHSNGTLEIHSLDITDEGWYTCCADYKGSVGANKVYLTVKQKPTVKISPEEIQFRKGIDFFLYCTFSGSPVPSVFWYKDGLLIDHDDRIEIEQINSTLSLTIRQPDKKDAGSYECRATNNQGVGSITAPVNYIEVPTIVSNEKRKFIKEGDLVIFSCNASGNPRPHVHWYKDSQKIELNNSILQPFSILYNDSLQIYPVDQNSSGVYKCQAENSVGVAEDISVLEIGYPPVIIHSPNNTNIEIEKNGTLYCDASGVPTPNIKWSRKNNKTISGEHFTELDHGRLLVKGVTENEGGVYVCTAENIFGKQVREATITVTGLIPPVLVKDEDNDSDVIRVAPGRRVVFNCDVSQGKPKPKHTWYFNGTKLEDGKETSFYDNGTLVVDSVSDLNQGWYECVISNPAGTDKKNTKLEMYTIPEIKPGLTEVEARLGKSVELECDASGNPTPTISWFRSGQIPLPMKQITSTGSLVIRNVTIQDEGNYFCNAENEAGRASWRTYLNVAVPAKIVSFPVEIFIMAGQVLELDCKVTGKPVPVIEWLKNNKTFDSERSNSRASSGFLRFTATRDDSGTYTCVATNNAGFDTRSATVIVMGAPRILNGGEEILQVVQGGAIKLKCEATGSPEPVISWHYKEAESSRNVDESAHFSIEYNELVIKKATTNLSGIYVCDAENTAGIAQKVFHLDVLALPQILETFTPIVNLTDGDDYSIPCTAIGHPAPLIFWQRGNVILRPGHQHEDLLVMQDNSLVLTSVTLESSGIYSCVAYNAAGIVTRNYTINVFVAPIVMDSSVTRVEIVEGVTGKLMCPITVVDRPASIVWLKDDKGVDFLENERADDVHFYTVENDRVLKIVEARSADSGLYSCVVTNPAGTSKAKFVVDVIVPPYFVNEFPETSFIVKQGSFVLFDCVVGGNPVPKINWRRLEKNVPVTEHTAPGAALNRTKQELKLTNVGFYHSGRYQCYVINKLGRIDRTFSLTVIGAPVLEGAASENLDLVSGDSHNLTCTITGTPEPQYSWSFRNERDGEQLLKVKTSYLNLQTIAPSNTGIYKCNASNEAGSEIKIFNITVLEPPSITGSDLTEDIKVRSDDYLVLTCIVSGIPKPAITWLHNGVILKNATNVNDGNKTQPVNNSYSVILPAAGGKYSCVATNKAGITEKYFNVKVLVAPKWARQRSYFRTNKLQPIEGYPLIITCPVTGDPPPDVHWLYNGRPISGIGVYKDKIHYTASNRSHSGNYTCFATNNAGNFSKNFTVDVLVAPKFLLHEELFSIQVSTNSTVTLNCSVDGNPSPQFLWLHKYKPTNHSGPILELDGVTVEDSGIYSCLASNSAGDAEKSFNLQVIEPPVMDEGINPVSNLTVKLHRRVAIKCPLSGSPLPVITWYKDGHLVNSDPQKMIELSDGGRQLQITFAVAEDAGSYRCVAENQAGIKELYFDLSVVIPLEWSEWAEWGPCNVSCGGGEQERKRFCGGDTFGTKETMHSNLTLVVLDKSNCLGDSLQHRKCNISPCQINDGWKEWSNWTSCSATCGESTRQRIRECKSVRPALDGLPCIGPSIQYELCKVANCSSWGEWSDWSDCSTSCGYGTQFRERKCNIQGGVCDGEYREVSACNANKCPIDARWSEWGNWSSCSVTCGRGTKQRNRVCNEPKYGGKSCEGDNVEIKECRDAKCHKRVPKLANIQVKGELNGEHLRKTKISAEVKNIRGKRVVTATVKDILKKQAGWFPYLTFLLPPVNWNVAEEEDTVSNNGLSLTDGKFEQESKFQFATGHELFVDSKGRGVNPKSGALEVDIEVIGEIPVAEPKSSVFIEPYTEDFIQTGKNKLSVASNTTIDVDGELVPFSWNKNVTYDNDPDTDLHLVERLSTDEIVAEYNPNNNKLHYSAATSITTPLKKNTCPRGFELEHKYQHCKDINECEHHKCHKSQKCENTFGSYICHCPAGFKSLGPGRRCADINECERHQDKCSHFCHNTRGSYKCKCPGGMILAADRKTCFEDYARQHVESSDNPEQGGNMDYSYNEGFPSDDWGGGAGRTVPVPDHNRYSSNYRTSEHMNNFYDHGDFAQRSAKNRDPKYLEHKKPAEDWTCPPDQIKEGNKCITPPKTQEKLQCNDDDCNEYETCLPTFSGHLCLQTQCPLKYHHDTRTKNCIQFCQEGFCENGAAEAEEVTFIPVPLESATIQRYQDLIELSVQGATTGIVFAITENPNLPLRVRIEKGRGVLYSLKYFTIDGIEKVVVVATTYDKNHATPIFINTFVLFIYDPRFL